MGEELGTVCCLICCLMGLGLCWDTRTRREIKVGRDGRVVAKGGRVGMGDGCLGSSLVLSSSAPNLEVWGLVRDDVC